VSKAILVVGAGFAGATYARELAEHGFSIDVIDKRPHVGGNAYDEVASSGVRIHKSGPHLFHTNNEEVVLWLTRFGEFVPYQHKVQAELADGRCVPLPINRRTINAVFETDLKDEADVRGFLARQAVAIAAPANAAEYLYATIGKTLTELLFRSYTRKMWDRDLEDMDAAVVKRVPIRYDDEDRISPRTASRCCQATVMRRRSNASSTTRTSVSASSSRSTDHWHAAISIVSTARRSTNLSTSASDRCPIGRSAFITRTCRMPAARATLR
jgi:protoporphyrinogen oxidase